MKGPANRGKFLIRRGWECPLCRRRVVTAGSVTQQACTCRVLTVDQAPAWMRLIDDPLPIVFAKYRP